MIIAKQGLSRSNLHLNLLVTMTYSIFYQLYVELEVLRGSAPINQLVNANATALNCCFIKNIICCFNTMEWKS